MMALGLRCVRITAVIPLYRMEPTHCVSLTSLEAALLMLPEGHLQLKVLLFDNAPGGQTPGGLPDNVIYRASPYNAGLAGAYNEALEMAEAEGYDWLLTLDQDTSLPPDFLQRVSRIAIEVEHTPSIAAIVPQITGDGRILSPYWFAYDSIPRWFGPGHTGVPAQPTYAFNSGSVLRVTALRQVGGYDPWFWLDNSDASTFRQLHRHGKRVFVAGGIQVAHNFSMMDMQNRVTPTRYRNILLAESAFWDLEMSTLAGLERTLRLVVRVFKHLLRHDSPGLRSVTYEFLWRRLFWTRKARVRAWEAETRRLFPNLPVARNKTSYVKAVSDTRFNISVCMATYSGEQYIEEQLRSILDQLRPGDEVIVVDDVSTDRTCEIIRSLGDDRVRLIEHSTNCGIVATFEDAVRNATGEIIFLADQDDVWVPGKVERVLEAFRLHPEAKIVATGVAMIDEHGRPSADKLYENRQAFRAGFWQNVWKNHFQGSAMAFRASLLDTVLPFPRGVEFLHDCWIGTRNALVGGGRGVQYVDEPLLLYRRHSRNQSRKMSWSHRAEARFQLLGIHLLRCVTNRPQLGPAKFKKFRASP